MPARARPAPTIGVVVAGLAGAEREVLRGVAAAAQGLGWRLRLYRWAIDRGRSLARKGFAGIVAALDPEPAAAAALAALGVPVVWVGGAPAGRCRVDGDGAAAAAVACAALRLHGYARLGFAGTLRDAHVAERLAGMRAAAGVDAIEVLDMAGMSASSPAHRRELLRRWAIGDGRRLGAVAACDHHGMRLCEFLDEAGIAVPDAVALVGIGDDEATCQLADPPLSSVAMPLTACGRSAVGLLAAALAGGALPRTPTLLPPLGVIHRGSTGFAGDDPLAEAGLRELAAGRSVAAAAGALGVSVRTLERRLRSACGRSPRTIVAALRLERARALLAAGLTPAQAARRSGFAGSGSLARALRR